MYRMADNGFNDILCNSDQVTNPEHAQNTDNKFYGLYSTRPNDNPSSSDDRLTHSYLDITEAIYAEEVVCNTKYFSFYINFK